MDALTEEEQIHVGKVLKKAGVRKSSLDAHLGHLRSVPSISMRSTPSQPEEGFDLSTLRRMQEDLAQMQDTSYHRGDSLNQWTEDVDAVKPLRSVHATTSLACCRENDALPDWSEYYSGSFVTLKVIL